MKKNRIIACIMILTMLLTSGVGNIGSVLTSFAQGKSNIIITDILNEKPIPTLDNKFLLEQNIEKISDTQLKINLKINGNDQDVNIKNTSVVNTLCDNLEICTKSVNISGIENSKDIKWKITTPRDKVTIDLGDISSKEVNISFEAKIRNSAKVGESIPLNLKADINYMLEGSDEEIVSSFPIPKFTLVENVQTVEPEEQPKAQTLSEDTTSNVETYSTRQNTTNPDTLPFPVTIRDFNADYIFFEVDNNKIGVGNNGYGTYGMVYPDEFSDEGKPLFTDAQITKMANLIYEQIDNIKIPKDFTSKSKNDSDRRLAKEVFTGLGNLTDENLRGLGDLKDAKSFYETNKNRPFSEISPTNLSSKTRLDTVYRYIYYYVNKLFVDTQGLNTKYTIDYDNNNNKIEIDNFIKELPLTKNKDGLYTYCDKEDHTYKYGFFPLNGKGFKQEFEQTWAGNNITTPNPHEYHNYHFTLESNTKFFFNPEEMEDNEVLTFEFIGDDDVWVYIGGNLVIDIGGQHEPKTQKITIDQDGNITRIYDEKDNKSPHRVGKIVKGWYDFDFFFIEKHTTLSNFKITTNIEFIPQIEVDKEAYIKTDRGDYKSIDTVYPGDTIYYKAEAINTGNVDLTNIVFEDVNLGIKIDKNGVKKKNNGNYEDITVNDLKIIKKDSNGKEIDTDTTNKFDKLKTLGTKQSISIESEDILSYEVTDGDLGGANKIENKIIISSNYGDDIILNEDTESVDVSDITPSATIEKVVATVIRENETIYPKSGVTEVPSLKPGDEVQFRLILNNETKSPNTNDYVALGSLSIDDVLSPDFYEKTDWTFLSNGTQFDAKNFTLPAKITSNDSDTNTPELELITSTWEVPYIDEDDLKEKYTDIIKEKLYEKYPYQVKNTATLSRKETPLGSSEVGLEIARPSLRIFKNVVNEKNKNTGFTITVSGSDGTKYNVKLNSKEKCTIENLKYGVTYTISELPIMNYELVSIDKNNIKMNSNNDNTLVTVKNKKSNDKWYTDSAITPNKITLTKKVIPR